jgi:hypothetical protein
MRAAVNRHVYLGYISKAFSSLTELQKQAASMDRRDFLQFLGIQPALAATTPGGDTARADTHAIDAAAFGAIGDGRTDSTRALQQAIDTALQQGKPCFIPSGVYLISAPLQIGAPSLETKQQGFRLYGAGRAVDRAAGVGGTLIVLAGSGHDAIVIMHKSAWRSCAIENLGLECSVPGAAGYGILFDSSEFSAQTIQNVSVSKSKVAFGILQGKGSNGEFTHFINCTARHVDKFFYSDAGQAYVQSFIHCTCLLNTGGTYFHLNPASGGGGLDILDFSGTGIRLQNNPSDTTFIQDDTSSSCLNVHGGRVEHVTQFYERLGDTTNLRVTANFTGLQITVDRTEDRPKPFIRIRKSPEILTFSSCQFAAVTGKEVINIETFQSWAYILFQGCGFDAFARPPYVTSDFSDTFNQVRFEDCKASAPIPGPYGRRFTPFERNLHHDVGAIGQRKAYSENGYIHSGQPVNLLRKPHFTASNGRDVKAEEPWVHDGATLKMNAFDWNSGRGGLQLASSSPWAKLIELPPQSGLHQDITSVDLGGADVAYQLTGYGFHVVAYQAMINRLAGASELRFRLTDSVTGEPYDELIYRNNSGDSRFVRLITLVATVVRKPSSSFVRLNIENRGNNWAAVEFAWQLAAPHQNPAFVGTLSSPAAFAESWGVNAESARLWHRLALPYKSDSFGSQSARALEDLRSDVYLSKDTERLTHFANGQWWPSARVAAAASEPDRGLWAQGDIVVNTRARPGQNFGWMQVTAGEFAAQEAWAPNITYRSEIRVHREGRVYECVRAGTSAGSGGPQGTDAAISDGECIWKYLGPLVPAACRERWSTRAYRAGEQAFEGGNVYECVAPGIAATPPQGSGSSIADGVLRWRFVGPLAEFKPIGLIGN